jgi:uncharacterized protein YndB with AHSA1/START domain
MSYELRLERLFDAPPEEVFDAFVDPAAQERLHGAGQPNWVVHRSDTDVRVGGTSVYEMGTEGQDPDVETRVYSASIDLTAWSSATRWTSPSGSVETEMTITFEDRDGGTLLTMVQTEFATEQNRDGFIEGWTVYLETLRGVVTDGLKARHDTDEPRGSER